MYRKIVLEPETIVEPAQIVVGTATFWPLTLVTTPVSIVRRNEFGH